MDELVLLLKGRRCSLSSSVVKKKKSITWDSPGTNNLAKGVITVVAAVTKMLRSAFLRKKKKMPSSSQSSGAHGVSDSHLAMEELPHPSRNLTVSRVVIMVCTYDSFSSFWWIVVRRLWVRVCQTLGSAFLRFLCIFSREPLSDKRCWFFSHWINWIVKFKKVDVK